MARIRAFADRRRRRIMRFLVKICFAGMIDMDFATIRKHVVLIEIVAFESLIILAWLSEYFDFPHAVMGAPASAPNFARAVLFTIFLVVVMSIVLGITLLFFKQIRYLEGFLPVCSFCKKIRVEDDWVPIEQYMHERASVQMTHSLCPPCAKEHYGYVEEEENGQ